MARGYKHILFADDYIQDQNAFKLAASNYPMVSYEIFEDGSALLDHINHKMGLDTPHLIILDNQMSPMDGIMTLKQLKKIDRLRCVPVIMFSESIASLDLQEAWLNDIDSYIQKPPSHKAMQATIKAFLEYWINLNHLPARF